jgi:type I restriction enzyme M protein
VGLAEKEDDFAERFASLRAEFESELEEEKKRNKLILQNLAKIAVEKK